MVLSKVLLVDSKGYHEIKMSYNNENTLLKTVICQSQLALFNCLLCNYKYKYVGSLTYQRELKIL